MGAFSLFWISLFEVERSHSRRRSLSAIYSQWKPMKYQFLGRTPTLFHGKWIILFSAHAPMATFRPVSAAFLAARAIPLPLHAKLAKGPTYPERLWRFARFRYGDSGSVGAGAPNIQGASTGVLGVSNDQLKIITWVLYRRSTPP